MTYTMLIERQSYTAINRWPAIKGLTEDQVTEKRAELRSCAEAGDTITVTVIAE